MIEDSSKKSSPPLPSFPPCFLADYLTPPLPSSQVLQVLERVVGSGAEKVGEGEAGEEEQSALVHLLSAWAQVVEVAVCRRHSRDQSVHQWAPLPRHHHHNILHPKKRKVFKKRFFFKKRRVFKDLLATEKELWSFFFR